MSATPALAPFHADLNSHDYARYSHVRRGGQGGVRVLSFRTQRDTRETADALNDTVRAVVGSLIEGLPEDRRVPAALRALSGCPLEEVLSGPDAELYTASVLLSDLDGRSLIGVATFSNTLQRVEGALQRLGGADTVASGLERLLPLAAAALATDARHS